MIGYLRLIGLVVVLGAIAASYGYGYTRGQASVFKGVIAGTASFQKEQEKLTKDDNAQSIDDTITQSTLKKERDDLLQKLKAARAVKHNPTQLANPTCPDSVPLYGDALDRVLQAARQANESDR